MRSRNDEEDDSESSDGMKGWGQSGGEGEGRGTKMLKGEAKKKKSVSKIGASAMHSSRYLPMTQKSGILKDRRRFAFKKQAVLPVTMGPSFP